MQYPWVVAVCSVSWSFYASWRLMAAPETLVGTTCGIRNKTLAKSFEENLPQKENVEIPIGGKAIIAETTTALRSTTMDDSDKHKKRRMTETENEATSEALPRRAKIVLLGDSITQQSFSSTLGGWGAYLSDLYQRRADVYNRGMSGYNTDWFLRFLRTERGKADVWSSSSPDPDVRLVTIFFGANDASLPELNPRHYVPLERYASNLKEIVAEVYQRSHKDVKIILICPPPVHHASRLAYQVQRYGDRATGKLERTLDFSGQYATACEAVGRELNLPVFNVWKEMQDATKDEMIASGDNNADEPWSKFLSDGLHLSREGNQFVGQRLAEIIAQHFPDLSVTPDPKTGFPGNSASLCPCLERQGPWHDEIDYTNPEPVFHQYNSYSNPETVATTASTAASTTAKESSKRKPTTESTTTSS